MVLVVERPRAAAGPRQLAASRRRIRMPRAGAPLLVGLAATLYVGIGNGVPSVWYDEAATITSATRSWAQLADELRNVDAVHGRFYALMHVWFDLVGYSPVTLRLPSALAVGATSAVLVLVLRSAVGARMGVLAGVLYPLIPRVAWAGGEGRSYALGALVTVALSAVLWLALRSHRLRWWALYALVAAFGVALFLYLALVPLAHAVTLALLARRGRVRLRDGIGWTLAVAAAAAATLPLVLLAREQKSQLKWVPQLDWGTLRRVLGTQWFWGSVPLAVLFWGLIVAGVIVLVRRRSELAAWIVPVLVVPTAVLLAATAVYSPLYSPRYLTFTAPAVAVAAAAARAAMPRPGIRRVALGVVFVLALPNMIVEERVPGAKQGASWSQVAAFIAERRAADPVRTAILYGPVRYHPTASTRVIAYAYPDAFAGTIDPTLRVPAAQTGQLWEERGRLVDSVAALSGADTAYLVTSVKRDRRPSYTAVLGLIGWQPVGEWHFTDVTVVQYAPTDTGSR
ncbi:MAG: glycosyltransferase family 39 protein [Micrococcales bacterium]|nr:glycosyltransferase family 39 protein [Micrococcales bacterium]